MKAETAGSQTTTALINFIAEACSGVISSTEEHEGRGSDSFAFQYFNIKLPKCSSMWSLVHRKEAERN